MAVYTDVAVEDLAAFLAGYELGELLAYKGIAEGVENSNFLVHTSRGNFILTLYEKRVASKRIRATRFRVLILRMSLCRNRFHFRETCFEPLPPKNIAKS